LDALRSRDEALGIEALRQHLQLAAEMVLKYFIDINNDGPRQAE
jgi:DNA-binding GntR family transcriptional regulator